MRRQRCGSTPIERIERNGMNPAADSLSGECRRTGGNIEYGPATQCDRIQIKKLRVFGKTAAKKRNARKFELRNRESSHGGNDRQLDIKNPAQIRVGLSEGKSGRTDRALSAPHHREAIGRHQAGGRPAETSATNTWNGENIFTRDVMGRVLSQRKRNVRFTRSMT